MEVLRGFVTVATGSERYYQLAYNLCLSYRRKGKGKYPFALICDKETCYNAFFDDIVMVDEAKYSTLDKMLIKYSPYQETIFFDADILILDSVDDLWDIFEGQADVAAFGCKLPLDSEKGWFTYKGSGRYRTQIQYLISMNGGIYYVRKGPVASNVFEKAQELVNEYSTIDFKYFTRPADEPIMAMAMVLNQCAPCDKPYEMVILPGYKAKISTDWHGNIYENGNLVKKKLIHFSTPRTKHFLYQYLNEVNHITLQTKRHYIFFKIKYLPADLIFAIKHSAGTILRKIGLAHVVERLKTILH